jgi:hypothetical protein
VEFTHGAYYSPEHMVSVGIGRSLYQSRPQPTCSTHIKSSDYATSHQSFGPLVISSSQCGMDLLKIAVKSGC